MYRTYRTIIVNWLSVAGWPGVGSIMQNPQAHVLQQKIYRNYHNNNTISIKYILLQPII